MPRRVHHLYVRSRHRYPLSVVEFSVNGVRMRLSPQNFVAGMQEDRRVECPGQFGGHRDVIVVTVSAHDGPDTAAGYGIDDRCCRVSGVDDDDLVVVTDDPNVVVHIPRSTVEAERSGRDHMLES